MPLPKKKKKKDAFLHKRVNTKREPSVPLPETRLTDVKVKRPYDQVLDTRDVLHKVEKPSFVESSRKNTSPFLHIKSFSNGFRYVGYHVRIFLPNASGSSEPFWADGIIKFWYPKFGYFFIHLLERSDGLNGVRGALDKEQDLDNKSDTSLERLTSSSYHVLNFSKYGNERGWVSPQENHLQLVSSTSVWHRTSDVDAKSFGPMDSESTPTTHESCHQCKKSIEMSFNTKDVLQCEVCHQRFHVCCLNFLNQKPFINFSQDMMCREAKSHRDYVVNWAHHQKLLSELQSSGAGKPRRRKETKTRRERFRQRCIKKQPKNKACDSSSHRKHCLFSNGSCRIKKKVTTPSHPNKRLKKCSKSSSDSSSSTDMSFLDHEIESPCLRRRNVSGSAWICGPSPVASSAPSFNSNNTTTTCGSRQHQHEIAGVNGRLVDGASEELNPSPERWRCPSCSVCVYCDESLNEIPPLDPHSMNPFWMASAKAGELAEITPKVICYVCGVKAHGACCLPKVPLLHPHARWKCDRCSICHICGYRSLESMDYAFWDPCFLYCFRCYLSLQAGTYCGVCRSTIKEVKSGTSRDGVCQRCRFQVHYHCDPTLHPRPEDSIDSPRPAEPPPTESLTKRPFLCAVCREGSPQERFSRCLERFFVLDRKRDFCFPVPFTCLSYWRVAKSPMNFAEMKAKVYYNRYTDALDFLTDLFLIFYNARMAYMPNTRIYRHASNLERKAIRFGFSILGLDKPTKQCLMDLSQRVAQRGAKDSVGETLLTSLQDCYDFEHLQFFPQWATAFIQTRDNCAKKLTVHRELNPPASMDLPVDNLDSQLEGPSLLTVFDSLCQSRETITESQRWSITSRRLPWPSSFRFSLPLWWTESETHEITMNATTCSTTTSTRTSPRLEESCVASFSEEFQHHLVYLSSHLNSKHSSSHIPDHVQFFLKTLVDVSLARYQMVCIFCCLPTHLYRAPTLLEACFFSWCNQHHPNGFASLCDSCSRCGGCGESSPTALHYSEPYPLYPPPHFLAGEPSHGLFSCRDSDTTHRWVQWIQLQYQFLEKSRPVVPPPLSRLASALNQVLAPSCALCHQFSHLSCETCPFTAVKFRTPTGNSSVSSECQSITKPPQDFSFRDSLDNAVTAGYSSQDALTSPLRGTRKSRGSDALGEWMSLKKHSVFFRKSDSLVQHTVVEPMDTSLLSSEKGSPRQCYDPFLKGLTILDVFFFQQLFHRFPWLQDMVSEDESTAKLTLVQLLTLLVTRLLASYDTSDDEVLPTQVGSIMSSLSRPRPCTMKSFLSLIQSCLDSRDTETFRMHPQLPQLKFQLRRLFSSHPDTLHDTSDEHPLKWDMPFITPGWKKLFMIVSWVIQASRCGHCLCVTCVGQRSWAIVHNTPTLPPFILSLSTLVGHQLKRWTQSFKLIGSVPYHKEMVSFTSTPEDDSSPLLLCRVCGRTLKAWMFDDLKDLTSCLLKIPFICEQCKARDVVEREGLDTPSLVKKKYLGRILAVIHTILKDLRLRFLSTQDVHSLLCALANPHQRLPHQDLEHAVAQFMDSPAFTAYRYRYLKDSLNFVLREASSGHPDAYVEQLTPSLETLDYFPTFHQWLAHHPQRPPLCDYTFSHTTLTLCLAPKLPLTSSTPLLHSRQALGPPLNILSDPLPYWWLPSSVLYPQALQWMLLSVLNRKSVTPESFHEAYVELSLLLGLRDRFYRWLSIHQSASGHPSLDTIHPFQKVHETFFKIPKPLLNYLSRLKKVCSKLHDESPLMMIQRHSLQFFFNAMQTLIQVDFIPSPHHSSQHCVLCQTSYTSLLLGPTLTWKTLGDTTHSVPPPPHNTCIHRECLLWSCVSLTKKNPDFSGDQDTWLKELHMEKEVNLFHPPEQISCLNVPVFIISFMYGLSSSLTCYFCGTSHPTLYCHSCSQGAYHLPCYFRWAATLSHPCFDLTQRLLYQCPRCYSSPSPFNTFSGLLKSLYPQGFLALLEYSFNPLIVLLHTSPTLNAPLFPPHPVSLPSMRPETPTPTLGLLDVWTQRYYESLILCFPHLSTQPLYGVEKHFESTSPSSLYDPFLFRLISPGNSLTQTSTFSSSPQETHQYIPFGFHSQRRFWNPALLSRFLFEQTTDHQKIISLKDCLTFVHCRIVQCPESATVYQISYQPFLTTQQEHSSTQPLSASGETLESCVSHYFESLLPLLKKCCALFHVNDKDILQRLPSPVDFFGLAFPPVLKYRRYEESLLSFYTLLNAAPLLNDKGSPTRKTPNTLEIDLTFYAKPYRCRLWMTLFPPTETQGRELSVTQHSSSWPTHCTKESQASQTLQHSSVSPDIYLVRSSREFPVQYLKSNDDLLTWTPFHYNSSSLGSLSKMAVTSHDSSRDPSHEGVCRKSRRTSSCRSMEFKTKRQSLLHNSSMMRPTRLNCRRDQIMKTPFTLQYKYLRTLMTQQCCVMAHLSGIHGMGLFAKTPIAKQQPIVEYIGDLIRNVVADRREELYRRHGMKDSSCYMFRLNSHYVVDGTVSGNVSRFINHSCEPNCVCRIVTDETGHEHIIIFAARPISTGEEITYDYKFNVEEESLRLKCLCGAQGCLGRMN